MIFNQTKLVFVFTLSLFSGIINATVLQPTGRVIQSNFNEYKDERGITCKVSGSLNKPTYTCLKEDNSVLLQENGNNGDAYKSFINFKRACGCD